MSHIINYFLQKISKKYSKQLILMSIQHLLESKTRGIDADLSKTLVEFISKSKQNRYRTDKMGNLIK